MAVLAPSRWLRAADVLPHDWDATSDSVAAFVAGALDAERLVLIKPASGGARRTLVDAYFALVLPVGLPWSTLGWRQVGELGSCWTARERRHPERSGSRTARQSAAAYAVRSRRAGLTICGFLDSSGSQRVGAAPAG